MSILAPVPATEATDSTGQSRTAAEAEWVRPTWEEVVTNHSAKVYRLAYRLTGNKYDAADLTQEVFVRVFRSLENFKPGTLDGWLHRITTNLFLDQARRKSRIRFLRRTWSRNRLVVIRCSQPSKVPGVYDERLRKTRTNTSWVRSSASCTLPVSR